MTSEARMTSEGCEVELFYDHSGVKPTFWVFHSSIEYFESGCGRLLTVLVTYVAHKYHKLSISVLYYTLIYSSVIVSWAVE